MSASGRMRRRQKNKTKEAVFFLGSCIVALAVLGVILLLLYAAKDNGFETAFLSGLRLRYQYALLTAAVLVVLGLIAAVFMAIELADEKVLKYLRLGCLLISAMIFVFLIATCSIKPSTDSFILLDQAKEMGKSGLVLKKSSPYYEYYGRFSNNYFLTIIFSCFYRFLYAIHMQDSLVPFFVLNGMVLYGSNVMGWRLVSRFVSERTGTKALFLLTINPVLYFYTFWVYSATLSIPFLLGIMYLGMGIYRADTGKKVLRDSIGIGIFAGISYYVRPTSLIPFIALVCLGILLVIKDHRAVKKVLLSFAAVFMCILLCSKVVTGINESVFSQVSDKAFPVTHWVMMSSHGDGTVSAEDEEFTMSFDTKEEKTAATIQAAKENYKTLGIKGTLKLWYHKIGVTFGDGFSQIRSRLIVDENMGEIQEWISGRYADWLALYCDAFRIVTLFLILWNLLVRIYHKAYDPLLLLAALTFVGGLLFYCLWEVKASYSIPFVPVMVLLAGMQRDGVLKCLALHAPGRTGLKRGAVAATILCGCLWLAGGVIVYNTVSEKNYTVVEQSLRSTFWSTLSMGGQFSEEEAEASTYLQEIPLKRDINFVDIYAVLPEERDDQDVVYEFSLLDTEKNVLCTRLLNTEDFLHEDGRIKISVGEISADENPTCYIQLKKLSEESAAPDIRCSNGISFGGYEGVLLVDGKESTNTIYVNAYRQFKSCYMGTRRYLLLFGVATATVMLAFLLLMWDFRKASAPESDKISFCIGNESVSKK